MKHLFLTSLIFITACNFHPLYRQNIVEGVCVDSIPEQSGYVLYQALKTHFTSDAPCAYTLRVQKPHISLSDSSISNKDFTTMQDVTAQTSYDLLNDKKVSVLSNTVSVSSTSAITSNPYASVVAMEKTSQNLYPLLAEEIALHVTAYLDRNNQ